MDFLSGLANNSTILGVVVVTSLIALATKELVARSNISHTNITIMLNVYIVITVGLFLYVFSRILLGILNVQ